MTWSNTRLYNQTISNNVCFTSNEVISTSSSEDFVGKDADIFIGTTLNIIWGINTLLEWDSKTCSVKKSKKMTANPKKFNSRFLYTRHFIENNLIPDLDTLEKLEVNLTKKEEFNRVIKFNKKY